MIGNDASSTTQVKRKLKLNYLILKWLISECHINAVRQFSQDLQLDLEKYIDEDDKKLDDDVNDDLKTIVLKDDEIDNMEEDDNDFFKQDSNEEILTDFHDDVMINNLKTINIRRDIKLSILQGDITKTFELINLNFPNLFDKNHLIYFKLLHLNLVEMIRSHVVLKSQRQTTETEERFFLDSVLEFVRLKLSSLKILSNKIFIKELELTMVLLCYTDELAKLYNRQNGKIKINVPLKLRRLFDKSQRLKISKLINKSILMDVNNDDDINLIRYDDDHEAGEEKDDEERNIGTDDEDLIMKFNQLDNDKLTSLIKLWIWSENKLARHDVTFPGINLDL